jgi:hypothetical protein
MAVRLRLGDPDLAASLSDFLCRRDCAAALPSSSAVAVQPSAIAVGESIDWRCGPPTARTVTLAPL